MRELVHRPGPARRGRHVFPARAASRGFTPATEVHRILYGSPAEASKRPADGQAPGPVERAGCGHEPAEAVQQVGRPARIQRKILIYGMPYSPSAKFLAAVEAGYGRHMKEFVENMYNHDKPPVYTFSTYQQLRFEIEVRHQATKGMDAAHAGCCGYPSKEKPARLDETYWVSAGLMRFKPKSPLPAGKDAADAVEAIFAPGANTRLDCVAMAVAVEYYSLLKGLGRARFNALFPGGAGLEISNWIGIARHPTFYGAKRIYKNVRLSSKSEILPGDWVYFENFRDYLLKHWGGYWQGENAIYMGGGEFRGFGTRRMSEAEMNAKLVGAYNDGLAAAEQKTVADLLAQGGGLQLSPVFRPDMSKLAP